jgi:hypothetical protein
MSFGKLIFLFALTKIEVVPKRAFFSSAGQGTDIANRLLEELKDDYDCFIPSRAILPEERCHSLQNAKWFLLILTKETLSHPQCLEGITLFSSSKIL